MFQESECNRRFFPSDSCLSDPDLPQQLSAIPDLPQGLGTDRDRPRGPLDKIGFAQQPILFSGRHTLIEFHWNWLLVIRSVLSRTPKIPQWIDYNSWGFLETIASIIANEEIVFLPIILDPLGSLPIQLVILNEQGTLLGAVPKHIGQTDRYIPDITYVQ